MIDKSRCAIVVPVYKNFRDYNENEQNAFNQILRSFPGREITIVCPEGLEGYENLNCIYFHKRNFTYSGYNSLLMSPEFYEAFLDMGYTYMCLIQLDVWIFGDNLEYFLDEFDKNNYDYIGAPWYGVWFCKDGEVGNGGFCIRRLTKFRDICLGPTKGGNEDIFFCRTHRKDLNMAPEKLALEFSFEEKPQYAFRLNNGKLPMGTHAYASTPDRLGFWKHFISGIKEIKSKAGNPFTYNNPNHTIGEND